MALAQKTDAITADDVVSQARELLAAGFEMSDKEDSPDLKASDVKKINVHLGGCPRWLAISRMRNFRRKAVRESGRKTILRSEEMDVAMLSMGDEDRFSQKLASPVASITLDAGVASLIHLIVPRDGEGDDTLAVIEAVAREVAWSADGVDDSSFSRLVQRSLLKEVAVILGLEGQWDRHFANAQEDLDKALRRPAGERRKQADLARGSASELEARQILRSLRPSKEEAKAPAPLDAAGLCSEARHILARKPLDGEIRVVIDLDEETQKYLLIAGGCAAQDVGEYLAGSENDKFYELRSLLRVVPAVVVESKAAIAEMRGEKEEVARLEAIKERVDAAFATAGKSEPDPPKPRRRAI